MENIDVKIQSLKNQPTQQQNFNNSNNVSSHEVDDLKN